MAGHKCQRIDKIWLAKDMYLVKIDTISDKQTFLDSKIVDK
jgi:hypothetical protein